jgi:hypothetical protein
MGSVTYDFLADSILFNDKEIENEYSSLNDNQLEKILDDYRNHCLKNINDLTKEVIDNKSSLKVLSSIEEMPFKTLKQSALYFDQFIIYDPLFALTHQKSEAANVMSEYLGYERNGLNRKKVVETVKLLKAITPMIAADFVKILPLSKEFEPPKDIPITLPKNYYADGLPKEIMDYCREKAIVRSMEKANKGWRILDKNDFTPGIFINFEGLERNEGQIYNYFLQEFEKTEDPNRFLTKMKLADYPMDKNIWDTWVFQSTNRSAIAVVDKIHYENIVATNLNATYLTDNIFTSNLLTQTLSAKETIETSSATQFMNIELPFLDKIDIDKLMTIRTYEADVFTNFRIELEREFRELRTVTDPKEIKMRQENIIHELGTVQVKKINQKLDSLKRKGFSDALILMGGIAGTVQTAGWSLLASAVATASGYKTYREYKDNLVRNPSYLLWKVLDK